MASCQATSVADHTEEVIQAACFAAICKKLGLSSGSLRAALCRTAVCRCFPCQLTRSWTSGNFLALFPGC